MAQGLFPKGLLGRHAFPTSGNVRRHWGSQPCLMLCLSPPQFYNSFLANSRFFPTLVTILRKTIHRKEVAHSVLTLIKVSDPSEQNIMVEDPIPDSGTEFWSYLCSFLKLSLSCAKCPCPHVLAVPILLCSLDRHWNQIINCIIGCSNSLCWTMRARTMSHWALGPSILWSRRHKVGNSWYLLNVRRVKHFKYVEVSSLQSQIPSLSSWSTILTIVEFNCTVLTVLLALCTVNDVAS